MSQVPVTTSNTTLLVSDVYSNALHIIITVMMAPISVGITISDHHDVALPSQLKPRDTGTDFVGLTNMLHQQEP